MFMPKFAPKALFLFSHHSHGYVRVYARLEGIYHASCTSQSYHLNSIHISMHLMAKLQCTAAGWTLVHVQMVQCHNITPLSGPG